MKNEALRRMPDLEAQHREWDKRCDIYVKLAETEEEKQYENLVRAQGHDAIWDRYRNARLVSCRRSVVAKKKPRRVSGGACIAKSPRN